MADEIPTVRLALDDEEPNAIINIESTPGLVKFSLHYEPEGETFETVFAPESALALAAGLNKAAAQALRKET